MTENNLIFATEEQQTQANTSGEQEVLTEKYLIFKSGDLLLGVNVDYVVEIITNHSITHLPMVPNYVKGIINLRGQIIPIVDIRQLLNKQPQDDRCIIVLNIEGTKLGILVDSVAQMIDIPDGSILPMPTQNAQKLICGMCTLPDDSGTMMVLDCLLLVHG